MTDGKFKRQLTITSAESWTSLGSVFVTSLIFAFSDAVTWPFWPSWQQGSFCLVRPGKSFLRPFLEAGDEWTRELLEATAADELGFADDVSRAGWVGALWPTVSSSLGTLLLDVDHFPHKTGGLLKRTIHSLTSANYCYVCQENEFYKQCSWKKDPGFTALAHRSLFTIFEGRSI